MTVNNEKIPLLKKYIENSFTRELSESFLEEQADLICQLMNSHYFATILFPNKFSDKLYYFSNNPMEFNETYLPLQEMDILQHTMINSVAPVSYQAVNKLDIPNKEDFFHPIQKIRPVSDCLYIPFTVQERLCGFTAVARAGLKSPIYDEKDLGTFDFLSSYLTENFIRTFSLPAAEANQAFLDKNGNILACGDQLKEVLREEFGEKYQTPVTAEAPLSRVFEMTFRSVIHRRPGSKGTLTLISGQTTWRLEFRLTLKGDYRKLPSGVPVAEVQLKEEKRGRDSLIMSPEYLKSRFELTKREIQVVDGIYRGLSNEALSRELKISLSTVKNHVWNIYNKVGVDNRTGLIFAVSQ